MAAFLVSCAHAISEEVRKDARTDVPFAAVKADIEKYVGSKFIWGGFIASARFLEEGSYIEIVQNPLDKYGDIEDTDVSQGRFLAHTEKELDPLIYEKGRLVTVAGTLSGGKTVQRKKDMEYTYPVLEILEIHLWKEEPDVYVSDYWYYDYPYFMGPPGYFGPYYPYYP